jgi:hypothetical protein
MEINDVIARLKAECPTLKNRVYGSVEQANALPTSIQTPCAFVIPMAEESEPNALIGGFRQRTTAQIGVVICIKNVKDARGESGHIELENVRKEVKAALNNWQAPDTEIPMEHRKGLNAGYDNLILRWNDVFTTQFYYRK